MRILRIKIENYRGVERADLRFPERGITIISGPNESGKSSLFEALDILLDHKDSTRRAGVLAVAPVHLDAPTRIEAELALGPHHLTYAKQLHRAPGTELRVAGPRPESLTGDEAHERVRALLATHLDLDLWRALRIAQGDGLRALELGRQPSLTRALEEAAGRSASEGAQSVLDAAHAELAKYASPVRRKPSKLREELAARRDDLARREQTISRQLRELEEHAERCATLEAEVAAATSDRARLEASLKRAREAVTEIERLEGERTRARLELDASTERLRDAERRTRDRADELRAIEDLDTRLAELRRNEVRATDALACADALCRNAAQELAHAEAHCARTTSERDALRGRLEQTREREQVMRLRAQIARAETLCEERDRAVRAHDAARVTDEAMRTLRDLWSRKIEAEASLRSTAADLRIESRDAFDVAIDGARVRVDRDTPLTTRVTEAAEWSTDGLKVVVQAGADSRDLRAELHAVEGELQAFWARYGVRGMDAASASNRHRNRASEQIAAADRQLAALLETALHPDLASMREELARRENELASHSSANGDDVSQLQRTLEDLREQVTGAEESTRAALRSCEELRRALDAARAHQAGLRHEVERERGTRAAAETEREKRVAALAAHRDAESDDEVREALEARRSEVERLRAVLAHLEAECRRRDASGARRALETNEAALSTCVARLERAVHEKTRLQAILEDRGEDGLGEARAAVRAELHRAQQAFEREERSAAAAALLVETLESERDAARDGYARALEREIEQLGRSVFGADFRVELDDDLAVAKRTLDGRTIDYASLSVGAREQIGLIARLACALLVGRSVGEGGAPGAMGVPVVLDDALGHSDAGRLEKIAETLELASRSTQVILLTCSPERYRWLPRAHRIEL